MSLEFRQFLPLGLLLLAALGFVVVFAFLPSLVGKRRTSGSLKDTPYECGLPPAGPERTRFSVRFYLVAMLFILFDIEVVFLLGWATAFRDLSRPVEQGGIGAAMLWGAVLFLAILEIGHFYLWRQGVMDWAPLRRDTRRPPIGP
jgi:NADH-quinone oxidoreductase subunit A